LVFLARQFVHHDFAVSFTPEEIAAPASNYNFGTIHFGGEEEAPGIRCSHARAVAIYHTYSAYARGFLDALNGAYQLLDLVPKGRDEEKLDFSMEWLRRRDEYQD